MIVITILLILISTPALSQSNHGSIELTPYGAYSFGGTFQDTESTTEAKLKDSGNFGLIFDYQLKNNTQFEVIYSQQQTDATVPGATIGDVSTQYLQLGGTYQFEADAVLPFMSATIGGTHISVDSAGFGSDTFFGFSLGAGVQIAPTRRFGLRLEARAFGTLLNANSRIFCGSDPGAGEAGCIILVDSDVLWQLQTMAGFVFRF